MQDVHLAGRLGIEGFTPFEGRDLSRAHNVKVHRNLNDRPGWVRYSITDRPSGLVLGHADKLALAGAWVHVNPAAQARIAAGANRSVHAWVYGQLTTCPADDSPWYLGAEQIRYDPHESPHFRWADCDRVFLTAPRVRFDEHGMWAVPPTRYVYSNGEAVR